MNCRKGAECSGTPAEHENSNDEDKDSDDYQSRAHRGQAMP